MKTVLRNVIMVILACVGSMLYASPYTSYSPEITSIKESLIKPQTQLRKSFDKRSSQAREAASGKITVRMVYDEEMWTPFAVVVFNKEYYFSATISELLEEQEEAMQKVAIGNLSEGRYDVLVSMQNNETGAMAFIVKENTTVSSNAGNTNVIVNIDNVETIDCKVFLPDGESVTLRTLNDDATDFVLGNTEVMYIQTYIFKEGIDGCVWSIYDNAIADIPDFGMYGSELKNVLISQVSPSYTIAQVFIIETVDRRENLGAVMFSRGFPESGSMSNNPATYTPYYVPPMKMTPGLSAWNGEPMELVGGALVQNGNLDEWFNSWSWESGIAIPSSVSYSSNFEEEFGDSYAFLFHNDLDRYNRETHSGSNRTIHSPTYFLSEEGAYYPLSFYRSSDSYYLPVNTAGNIETQSFPGNPALSVSSAEMDYIMGNSAPMFQTFQYNLPEVVIGNDRYAPSVGFFIKSIGRIGEVRNDDLGSSGVKVSRNGKAVTENASFYDIWRILEEKGQLNGVFKVDLRHENVDVDGVKGFVEQNIEWNQDLEDNLPPCLQMLQFRNSENVLTDCFDSPSDATIRFAATDIVTYRELPEMLNYVFWKEETGPMDVKAEWRPYADDGEWSEILLTQDEDNSGTWGFGGIYNGSLESVDKPSINQWYDIRISLEDPAGNTQVQTISPAFRIDNVSDSINPVVSGNEAEHNGVSIWTLQGILVKCNATKTDLETLKQGVYIIKSGSKITKKIIL